MITNPATLTPVDSEGLEAFLQPRKV